MKPIVPIIIHSLNKTSRNLNAVFDTGSFYSIVRSDLLPAKTQIIAHKQTFRTANKKGSLAIIGETSLILEIGEKMIKASVLISPDLGSDMLIGAQTMQSWDISIMNKNGKTKINVAHDMRDPEINEVDYVVNSPERIYNHFFKRLSASFIQCAYSRYFKQVFR